MSNYVDRFTTWERVLHWLLAVAFFVLIFTGLGLFSRTFFGFFHFFGGPQQGILIHKIAGVVFFLASVLLFFSHVRDVVRFDADDRRWFSSLGGYLTRKRVDIPQGKFNAGEKVFGLFSFFATLVMGLTGLVIWDPTAFSRGLTRVSLMVHVLFFVLFITAVIVHVYLATIGNPGTVEGMLWGRVRRGWARKNASKWYEEVAKD